jgi:vWA-MoxR associated protein C-terminal domain
MERGQPPTNLPDQVGMHNQIADRNRSTDQPPIGRVLVAVQKTSQLEHYSLKAWVQTARGDLQQLPPLDDTKTNDPVPYAWSKLGEWFADLKLRVEKYKKDKTTECDWIEHQIELFLPSDLLNRAIDQVTPEAKYGYHFALGEEHRVVVRSADRLEQNYPYRSLWEGRWKKLKDVGKTYATEHLLPANCSSDEFGCLIKQQLNRPNVIGIRRSKPPEPDSFIRAILQAGLPVAAWVRQDVPDLDCAAELDRLLGCEIATLPDRIFEARYLEMPIAQHVSLLWDDPNCLPPDYDAYLIS